EAAGAPPPATNRNHPSPARTSAPSRAPARVGHARGQRTSARTTTHRHHQPERRRTPMTTHPIRKETDQTTPGRLVYTIAEAAAALRISRPKLYELPTTGKIESVHIGRSRKIPADALAAYLDALRAIQPQQGEHA